MSAPHIDCFTSRLEDLRGAARSDPFAVFDSIVNDCEGKFSTFDVERGLETPVSWLFERRLLTDTGEAHPWVSCEPTPMGILWRAHLAGECVACGARGYTTVPLTKRSVEAITCQRCSGKGMALFDASPRSDTREAGDD